MNVTKRLLAIVVVVFIARPGAGIESMTIDIAGAPTFGGAEAPVTLVEFTDYECRFCRRHAARVQPRLIEDYVESGKLRYVMRAFPRKEGPGAKAAEAALCARDQGRYLEMHRTLLNNQSVLTVERLQPLALLAGLDTGAFKECLETGRYSATVQRDARDAEQAGIREVPAFFVGYTDPARPGDLLVLKSFPGAKRYGYFQEVIDQLLGEKKYRTESERESTHGSGASNLPRP